jgi:cytidyltransferase-like protein
VNDIETVPYVIRNKHGLPKIHSSYASLVDVLNKMKALHPHLKIAVVPGSYDLVHIGHARYFERAAEAADIVVVLIDPDAAIKIAKGEGRPVVDQNERVEMVAHLLPTDFVVLMEADDYSQDKGLWEYKFLELIRPDFVVVSKHRGRALPGVDEYIEELRPKCEEVLVLEPQAETSTTNRVRKMMLEGRKPIIADLRQLAAKLEEI